MTEGLKNGVHGDMLSADGSCLGHGRCVTCQLQSHRLTAGTGLVGSAIRHTIENEPRDSPFGRRDNEKWVFLSSKDCDLRCGPRHSDMK